MSDDNIPATKQFRCPCGQGHTERKVRLDNCNRPQIHYKIHCADCEKEYVARERRRKISARITPIQGPHLKKKFSVAGYLERCRSYFKKA